MSVRTLNLELLRCSDVNVLSPPPAPQVKYLGNKNKIKERLNINSALPKNK
jgi:hypothetical protein